MRLDGTSWSKWAQGFGKFLRGKPEEAAGLTPVDGAGRIEVRVDEETVVAEDDGAVLPRPEVHWVVYAQEALALNGRYADDNGRIWTVISSEPESTGGVAMNWRVVLRRHVGVGDA